MQSSVSIRVVDNCEQQRMAPEKIENYIESGLTTGAISTRRWYERLAAILGASTRRDRVLELIGELIERLGADSTLILRFAAHSAPQLIYGNYPSEERVEKIREYLSGHYALDPFYLRITDCAKVGVMSLREVIEESFDSSEYYRAHYRRAGLIDEICFCCRDGEGGHLTLSMSRAAGKERYSEDELEAARRISPIVTRLLMDGWQEVIESHPTAMDISTMDQHRLIENARVNFGRSILTRREYEILQFLLQGKSIAFISRALNISINTTRVHRKNIYAKLNIRSGSEVFTLFLDVVSKTDYIADRDPLIEYQGAHTASRVRPLLWLAAQR